MRIARSICFLLVGIYFSQILFYYPNLPEYIASNFDGNGNAQAWTPKFIFFLINILILLIPFLIFLFLPKLLERFPDRLLNIPNKDHWLASERRPATFEKIAKHFELIFIGIISFSIIITQMVIRANTGADKRLSSYFLVALIGFFIYLAGMIIKVFLAFRKPK